MFRVKHVLYIFLLIGVLFANAEHALATGPVGRYIYGRFVQATGEFFVDDCSSQFSGLTIAGWRILNSGVENFGVTSGSGLTGFCDALGADGSTSVATAAPFTNGTSYIEFESPSGTQIAYSTIVFSGGVGTTASGDFTRIITVTPTSGSTAGTSTAFVYGVSGYVSATDFKEGMFARVGVRQDAALQCTVLGCLLFSEFDFPLYSSGYFSTTTTATTTNIGLYTMVTDIRKPYLWLFDTAVVSTTTHFTVYALSGTDLGIAQGAGIILGLNATTTADVEKWCNIFEGFNMFACMRAMFIPSTEQVTGLVTDFKVSVSKRFPLGYVSDFISIITASSTGGLPVLRATVPPGIPGAGASITLDPTHSLDYILNADLGTFTNVSASSTKTFYQYTSYYWNLIVYLLAGLYLMSRILGSHVIPRSFHKLSKK